MGHRVSKNEEPGAGPDRKLLGNLSQGLETPGPPPIFDYSLSNGGLKPLIRTNQSDQKFLTEKIMKNSSFYFGPRSPKNRFLRFVRKKFTKKWAGNTGITSETTITESRVRRRFRACRQPAAFLRSNGFSVLRIFLICYVDPRSSSKGQARDRARARARPGPGPGQG